MQWMRAGLGCPAPPGAAALTPGPFCEMPSHHFAEPRLDAGEFRTPNYKSPLETEGVHLYSRGGPQSWAFYRYAEGGGRAADVPTGAEMVLVLHPGDGNSPASNRSDGRW